MRHVYVLSVALGCMLAAACSPPSAGAGSTPGAARRGGSVITQVELQESSASNALDAVQRLRPNFLASRGQSTINGNDQGVVVYANGQRLGGTDSLRDIPIGDVKQIEYLNSADATQRFGTGHGHGAILVTRK